MVLDQCKTEDGLKNLQDIMKQDEKDNPGQPCLWDQENVVVNINLMSSLKKEMFEVEKNIKQLTKW